MKSDVMCSAGTVKLICAQPNGNKYMTSPAWEWANIL